MLSYVRVQLFLFQPLEEKTDSKPEKLSTEYYIYGREEIQRAPNKRGQDKNLPKKNAGKKKGGFADADLSALSEEELARQAELLELDFVPTVDDVHLMDVCGEGYAIGAAKDALIQASGNDTTVLVGAALAGSTGGTAFGGNLPIVYLNNYGTPADYSGVDVRGKVAVVKRGSNSFGEKVTAAADAGAVGILIVNIQSGIVNCNVEGKTQIPHASLLQEVGPKLAGKTSVPCFQPTLSQIVASL